MATSLETTAEREKVRAVIADSLRAPLKELNDEAILSGPREMGLESVANHPYQGTGAYDSLTITELQIDLEDKFSIDFDDKYKLPETVGEVITEVLRYSQANSS